MTTGQSVQEDLTWTYTTWTKTYWDWDLMGLWHTGTVNYWDCGLISSPQMTTSERDCDIGHWSIIPLPGQLVCTFLFPGLKPQGIIPRTKTFSTNALSRDENIMCLTLSSSSTRGRMNTIGIGKILPLPPFRSLSSATVKNANAHMHGRTRQKKFLQTSVWGNIELGEHSTKRMCNGGT